MALSFQLIDFLNQLSIDNVEAKYCFGNHQVIGCGEETSKDPAYIIIETANEVVQGILDETSTLVTLVIPKKEAKQAVTNLIKARGATVQ